MHPAERKRLRSLLQVERALRKKGYLRIAGVDEAGRGPLAGPVVAAACIFPPDLYPEHLNDSKQLTPEQRETLFAFLAPRVEHRIALVEVAEIDRLNIFHATMRAMQKAIEQLKPDYALIDGNRMPPTEIAGEALVKGDGRSLSIAAASIFAKVTRDRLMVELARQYPQYGFEQHKGYGTPEHLAALVKWGPCPLHRRSFEPIKSMSQLTFF